MSTTMDQIHHIRMLFYEQGKNISEIAAETGFNWKTVRKYVDQKDFNEAPPPPATEFHFSKLDPFKSTIDEWLLHDKKVNRKQRHTAQRIFNRLLDEVPGFNCSYRLVATYVSQKKKELRLKTDMDFYIPLIHHPGEAQADFGQAEFYENGKHYKGVYFVLSFPYSNSGFLQLCYGESLEFLLESLVAIFEYIGGIPTEIWFDNDSVMVNKILKDGKRKVNERFLRFSEHYRFKPVFMNPESGNEKGSVESKVGYVRRNLLVPVPEFTSLLEWNQEILTKCARNHEREHYLKDDLICDLFQTDKKALLCLPNVRYDTDKYLRVTTDKYGKFTLNGGKHTYSASPAFCCETVAIRVNATEVIVLDKHEDVLVRHHRLHGDNKQSSMEWLPYLKYIARKPRSLKNSGIYDMMPEDMQLFMDRCNNQDRGKALKTLAELTAKSGFDSALHTVNEAIKLQAVDPESLSNLYRRLYSNVPVLPPINVSSNVPRLNKIILNTDLSSLDALLMEGGVFNGRNDG